MPRGRKPLPRDAQGNIIRADGKESPQKAINPRIFTSREVSRNTTDADKAVIARLTEIERQLNQDDLDDDYVNVQDRAREIHEASFLSFYKWEELNTPVLAEYFYKAWKEIQPVSEIPVDTGGDPK